MAFKKIKQVEETIYANRLRLANDGNSITGVFLYKDYDDVLVADAHYVKTKKYSGYVHCCGDGCPACQKGIRIQGKLFVPFLVLADLSEGYEENTVVFWDRSTYFNYQLCRDVFDKYPNPTSIVFKITRNGEHGDRNTRYSITPVMNFTPDIDEILNDMGVHFPEYYDTVIKDVDSVTLSNWLNEDSPNSYIPSANYSYQAKPRKRMADPEDLDSEDDLPGEPVEFSESYEEDNLGEDSSNLPSYVSSSDELDSADENQSSSDEDDDDDCEPTF